jgi:hypothetical protein
MIPSSRSSVDLLPRAPKGALFFGSSRTAGARARVVPGILSHLAHGSPSSLRSTLGRRAMRPWCPPSLLRQALRVRKGRPLPRLMYLLAYGRSTCPELASRVDTKVSHDDTVSGKESQQPKRRCFVSSTLTNLRDGKSLRCPPSRRVPDKWSGRRPDGYMGRAAAFPVRNAKGCLSSEGGHRRLCALPATHRRLCAANPPPAVATRTRPVARVGT